MKIVVITMHAVKNYGSVLQTYATEQILKGMGYDVEIINYIRQKNLDSNLLKTWTQNDSFIKALGKKIILLPTVRRWKKVFWKYLRENVSLTKYSYTYEEDFKKHPVKADIYCTGSDQVWNSDWNEGVDKRFYLDFAPKDSIRVALAASIGRESLSNEEMQTIKPLLENYNSITLRESSALNIMKQLDIPDDRYHFCLDPTLLLSKEQWCAHAKPITYPKKYILVYQLNHDRDFDEYVTRFAKRKNLEIVRICTRFDQFRLPGHSIFIPEVKELLGWFNNAEYIVTNSFHATAFSINLNKQFIAVFPDKFGCRIRDILSLFGLENRRLTDFTQYNIADEPIDYLRVNEILKNERKKSLKQVEKMFDIYK